MEQVKTPNLDPVVYVNGKPLTDWMGWCLAVSETAFGVPRLYANAWEGWNATKLKHKDRNFPKGVYFPIWFDGYWQGKRYGHVAIYKDGKIWSSPYTSKPYMDVLNSIEEVERIYGMKYVGWSEDIAGVNVIKKNEEKKEMVDYETMEVYHRFYFSEGISEYSIKNRVGKMTGKQVRDEFVNHPRFIALVAERAKSQTGFIDHLPSALRKVVKLPEQVK